MLTLNLDRLIELDTFSNGNINLGLNKLRAEANKALSNDINNEYSMDSSYFKSITPVTIDNNANIVDNTSADIFQNITTDDVQGFLSQGIKEVTNQIRERNTAFYEYLKANSNVAKLQEALNENENTLNATNILDFIAERVIKKEINNEVDDAVTNNTSDAVEDLISANISRIKHFSGSSF